MKKLLLFTFALLAFASTRAQNATVTETDVSGLPYVIYMESCEYPKGTGVVDLYVRVKSEEVFLGSEFLIDLPDGLVAENEGKLYGVDERCADPDAASYTYSITDAGYVKGVCYYNSAGTGESAYFTSGNDGNDRFCSVKVDISSLDVGEYPLVIRPGAIVSGRISDDKAQTIETEIVSKLVITNEVILDEESEEYPGTYAGVNVKVLRTISANNWNTLCLPFNMSEEQCKEVFGDDVQLAEYTGYEYNEEKELINVRFTEISSITANRPCIIKVSNATDHENGFKVKNVDITPVDEEMEDGLTCGDDAGGMYGTYVNGTPLYTRVKVGKQWVETQYVFLSGNNFYYATADSKPMKGFRAYFWFEDEAITALADGVKFNFSVNDDEPTSIDGISTIEKVADGVYNVSGQKVSESSLEGLPKGVYIVNGKKVFKK